jgi:hypothetical protein
VLVTGVVRDPEHPTAESGIEIDWMVGTDISNTDPQRWDSRERRLGERSLLGGTG